MKIKSVEQICYHHIEMENGDEYRRLSPYNWEKLWGSSWEQVYINPSEETLEGLYREYNKWMPFRFYPPTDNIFNKNSIPIVAKKLNGEIIPLYFYQYNDGYETGSPTWYILPDGDYGKKVEIELWDEDEYIGWAYVD